MGTEEKLDEILDYLDTINSVIDDVHKDIKKIK